MIEWTLTATQPTPQTTGVIDMNNTTENYGPAVGYYNAAIDNELAAWYAGEELDSTTDEGLPLVTAIIIDFA